MNILLDRNGQRLEDHYPELAADQSVPADEPVLVPWARFGEIPESSRVGLWFPNTIDVFALPEAALRLPLLVLEFPTFADGRAYSQAISLIRRRRYGGELRARGQAVVYDQLAMLLGCGFTQLQLRSDQQEEICSGRLKHLSLSSQHQHPSA